MERSRQSMTMRRLLTTALVLALGLPTAFSLLPGCDSTPSEPVYDNPFDPDGPDAGDPLKVLAEADNTANSIKLSWFQPQGLGLTHYVISRSAYRDSGWSELDGIDHTTAEFANYPYTSPEPTSTTWFRVQAFAGDNFSITSYADPDSATTGPRLVVGGGSGNAASRFTDLEITVVRGDSLRIALDPDFTDSLKTVPAGVSGFPLTLPYDLGPAPGNSQTKKIYVESFADGYRSVVSSKTLLVEFDPDFTVVGKPKTVATRAVDLAVPTAGVLQMRFFAEWTDTAATPWEPAAEIRPGYLLSDSANPQFIRAQFRGDFGFDSLGELKVTPDLLKTASFRLDLPDDHVSDRTTVTGISAAVATEMRYSESADFTNAPWFAYEDTVQIVLSPAPGRKVVYVQYRNDWTQSGTLTDYVFHVTQPAEVSFWAPADGDVLLGGSVFQVRGGSTVGSGAGSVILVKFDEGDGAGFVDADGTDAWSYLWDVPRFTRDTELTLRAQAWYGPSPDSLETVTSAITVTVTQLAVAITNPRDGADLPGNRTYNFTGTAAGILGGAPLESVGIDIGGDHIEASGTANWSAEWDAPLWDADSTLTLTATVRAGGDSTRTAITVDVITPPVAITSPAAGTLLAKDTDVTVSGVTFADLFTAPVDSVVLDVKSNAGDAHLPAVGTDNWSAVWRTPVVTANVGARIIATAFAGSESRADTVSVTVKP